MEGIRERIRAARNVLNPIMNRLEHIEDKITEEDKILWSCKKDKENILQAQKLIQGVAEAIQQRVHDQIANVVTECLKAVFGEYSYEFRIVFEQKRGKTEAKLVFTKDNNGNTVEIDDVINSSGGGVVDVASFALRLSCLILSIPKRRRILILDEPFKHLSISFREKVSQLIETLSKEMGIQIIMVTHSRRLACGKVVELSNLSDLQQVER